MSKILPGPFIKRDVAVPRWCNNPAVIRDRQGGHLLFHIGNGGRSHGFLSYTDKPDGPWPPSRSPHTSGGSRGCNSPPPAAHPNGAVCVLCGGCLWWAPHWQDERTAVMTPAPSQFGWREQTIHFYRAVCFVVADCPLFPPRRVLRSGRIGKCIRMCLSGRILMAACWGVLCVCSQHGPWALFHFHRSQ